jgi:hypothetical protein
LSYDNQRLLSERDWNQNGLAYDAVVLKIENERADIHIGTSWNSLEATTSENFYPSGRIKSLNFLWIEHKFSDHLKGTFSQIASGVTKTDSSSTINFRQTSGIYIDLNTKNIRAKSNLYYQFGNNQQGTNVSALLADVDIMFKTGKICPGMGFSYLSGNKNLNGKTDHLFDVLYGARHRFFGHMDYFRNISSHTRGGGLVDFYGYLNLKVTDKINIKNTGHFFSLAQHNLLTPDSKYLGYENELKFNYRFEHWGNLEAAWLFYLTTDSFEQLQNINNPRFPQFVYVSLSVNTNIFKEIDR